jgi:hypothetical protein
MRKPKYKALDRGDGSRAKAQQKADWCSDSSVPSNAAQPTFWVFAVRDDGRRTLYTRCATRDAAIAVVAKLIAFGLAAEVAQ